MRIFYHAPFPTIETGWFLHNLAEDLLDILEHVPVGMPLRFLQCVRNQAFPMYCEVFNEHPMPSIQGGTLIMPTHNERPFLKWISQELDDMSAAHLRVQMDLAREIPIFTGTQTQLAELSRILYAIPLKIQANHARIRIETTNVLSSSIKILADIRRKLMQPINPGALDTLDGAIFAYRASCQKYIRSCRELCSLFKAFSNKPQIPPQMKSMLLDTVNNVLIKEITLFEFTIAKPLQSLVLGHAEQTRLGIASEYLWWSGTALQNAAKLAVIVLLPVAFILAFLYFQILWAIPIPF